MLYFASRGVVLLAAKKLLQGLFFSRDCLPSTSGRELKKSLYSLGDKQRLPTTKSLIWTGSVLVCNLNTVRHEIAFLRAECLHLPAVSRQPHFTS